MEKKEHRAIIEKELQKVKGQKKEGKFKTRHKKLKFSGKSKSHINESLTSLVRTRHMATMRVASPLRIKCGTIP